MSNYLDNLVARHLDKSAFVQPRLASLFETPHTGALKRAPRNVEPFEFNSSRQESDDAGLVESRRSAEALFNSDLYESRTQASSDEFPITVWRGRQRILPSSLAEVRLIEPADSYIPVPVRPRPMPTQAAITKPTDEQATIEDAPGSFSKGGDAALTQNIRQDSPEPVQTIARTAAKNDARAQAASINLRQTGVEASPVDSIGKGIVVYPRIASRVESQKAKNDSPAPSDLNDAQPTPTINVTIGRVEVRATLPATKPHKQSPAAPLMGLDEYLRKRAKGDD